MRNVALLSINLPTFSAYICYSFLRILLRICHATHEDGHWKEEVRVASASSGMDLFERCDCGGEKKKGEKRNKKRRSKSRRVWFLSASRYQTEGGHMKLANVPTCPFTTYRVFPVPCSRVESEKRTARLKAIWDKRKSESWKAKVEGGSREGGCCARRDFLLISRIWLKLVHHKNQVSSLPDIRYRSQSFLSSSLLLLSFTFFFLFPSFSFPPSASQTRIER